MIFRCRRTRACSWMLPAVALVAPFSGLAALPASVQFNGSTATLQVVNESSGLRQYSLETTASLRDPNSPRRISIQERAGTAQLRSGSQLFDGLFALAQQELQQNSVSRISDPSFATQDCECFQTGELWKYVWTRDTSYSVELALGMLDPSRSVNSLLFKISPRRSGDRPEIVQDTGSGGSWPVSTDRVVWAMGAWETLKYLDGQDRIRFRDLAYQAIVNTIESDRDVVFDPADGLYRGETSFLDWREQTYPSWTADQVVHIGMSKALSTNVAHYAILTIASQLAGEKGDSASAKKYSKYAGDLRLAIQRTFWLSDAGQFGAFTATPLDGSVVRKFDLLGESLAILLGVADTGQAASIVRNYPQTEAGPPVIWPQQPDKPVYHNRALWPFVTAYAARAARAAGNPSAAHRAVLSIVRGSALALSNMENFEFFKQTVNEPVVDSRRQLWSVAGYFSMVLDTLLGREASQDGIRFRPFVPEETRKLLLGDGLALRGLKYKGKILNISLKFPSSAGGAQGDPANTYYEASRVTLNGAVIAADSWLRGDSLLASNELQIDLVARTVSSGVSGVRLLREDDALAPVEPRVSQLRGGEGSAYLEWDSAGDSGTVFSVYRNGHRVADGLTGRSWTDNDAAAISAGTACYSVEARFSSSGNVSQRSEPTCLWPAGTVEDLVAGDSRWSGPTGYPSTANDHGRFHFNDWGWPGQVLQFNHYVADRTGKHLFQMVYGNGFNDVSTGVTGGVKRLEVIEEASGKVVSSGAVILPQLGSWDRWSESSFLSVQLAQGRAYAFRITDLFNMSYLKHFEPYQGPGGKAGAINRVNLSGLRVLK